MEQTRFEQGIEQLRKIDGVGGENIIKSLEDIAPDVGKYIIEFAFGDIYPRKELSLQEREMITITGLLTAGGCEPQLEVHINGSLNVGIAPEKIIETFIQCIPYTGFPKVLNAIFVAKKIFAERGIIFAKEKYRTLLILCTNQNKCFYNQDKDVLRSILSFALKLEQSFRLIL